MRIVIQNKHGEKLVGLLRETSSLGIVILCHGYRSSKECKSLVTIATALAEEGISSFCFDFAGNGESEGLCPDGTYSREAEDLRAVILHFSRAKRAIQAIVGHSKGANVALLYASRHHDVLALVNISGCVNLMRGMAKRLGKDFMQRIIQTGFIEVRDKTGNVKYCVTKESLMDRLTTDVGAICQSIGKSCRVLTVHGSRDELVPVKDALEFDKLICNNKLHIIRGADHEYTEHQAELASVVVNFLKADESSIPNEAPPCPNSKQSVGAKL